VDGDLGQRTADRRLAGPLDPPGAHPGDERGKLSVQRERSPPWKTVKIKPKGGENDPKKRSKTRTIVSRHPRWLGIFYGPRWYTFAPPSRGLGIIE